MSWLAQPVIWQATGRTTGVEFPSDRKIFFFRYHVQTSSRAQGYEGGEEGSFHKEERPVLEDASSFTLREMVNLGSKKIFKQQCPTTFTVTARIPPSLVDSKN